MYKTLTKNGQLIAFGIGLFITIGFLLSVFSGINEFSSLGKEAQYGTTIFNFGLYAVIALAILCAVAMLVFGIIHVVSNPKGSMKGLIGIGVILVIFFLAYSTATVEGGAFWERLYKNFNVSNTTSKLITGGIWTCLAMIAIAIVAFVLSEIRNFFK